MKFPWEDDYDAYCQRIWAEAAAGWREGTKRLLEAQAAAETRQREREEEANRRYQAYASRAREARLAQEREKAAQEAAVAAQRAAVAAQEREVIAQRGEADRRQREEQHRQAKVRAKAQAERAAAQAAQRAEYIAWRRIASEEKAARERIHAEQWTPAARARREGAERLCLALDVENRNLNNQQRLAQAYAIRLAEGVAPDTAASEMEPGPPLYDLYAYLMDHEGHNQRYRAGKCAGTNGSHGNYGKLHGNPGNPGKNGRDNEED